MLNRFLSIRGYSVDADSDRYGAATRAAVKNFATSIGVERPTGLSFDAAWLVYLPSESYLPAESKLLVGAPAPPAGESIASAAPELTQAVLTPPTTTPGGVVPADDASAARCEQRVSHAVDRLVAEPSEHLMVGGLTLELSADRTSVDPTALSNLADVAGPSSDVMAGRLISEPQAGEFVVPSSAVVAERDGTTCVILATQAAQPLKVEVIANVNGNAIVRGDLGEGENIQASPPVRSRTCG